MHLLWDMILILSSFCTLSQAQNLLYTDRRRSGYSYTQPSQSSVRALGSYSGPAGFYRQPSNQDVISPSHREAIRNYGLVPAKTVHPPHTPYANNKYSSSSSNANNFKKDNSPINDVKRTISKADAANAKFVGAENQENDYDSRTLLKHKKKFNRRLNAALRNPCLFYGRDVGKSATPPPREQGRFLWDINVHNYYPQSSLGLGCGGYGGFGSGGFGAGLLSDPIGPAYYPAATGIANFLSLFAPGILQNSLAGTAPPQQFADYSQMLNEQDLQSDPAVDPNYRPGPASVPVRKPNVVFYDTAGAPPLTPGQLVGGVSTTVNGIIQQLTGNVQPVYG